MRKLTRPESSVVRTLGSLIADDELRSQCLLDIDEVEVTDEAPDGSRLLFHLPNVQLQAYRGQDSFRGRDGFPVEGKLLDADGERIDVYFYHVDGRMFELELLRPDGQPVLNPNWTSFTAN
jgi:hypothetical protein